MSERMTANELVDKLEEQQLLPASLIERLRDKASGPKALSAKALSKFLVDKGHLTKHQASTLLSAVADEPVAAKEEPAKKEKKRSSRDKSKSKDKTKVKDDPSFSSLPDLGSPLDGLSDLASTEAASADPLGGATALAGDESGKSTKKKKRKKSHKQSNEWDSPLILIGGGAFVLLLVAIAVMYFVVELGIGR